MRQGVLIKHGNKLTTIYKKKRRNANAFPFLVKVSIVTISKAVKYRTNFTQNNFWLQGGRLRCSECYSQLFNILLF